MCAAEVLLIDDDAITIDALQMLLEYEGFHVTTCKSGSSALDLARQKHFDAFLIDYRMPDINGDELTRLLRPLCRDIPLIGISGESKGKAFLEAGADVFIDKMDIIPVLITFLKSKIKF